MEYVHGYTVKAHLKNDETQEKGTMTTVFLTNRRSRSIETNWIHNSNTTR